jgi:hypothetical protein
VGWSDFQKKGVKISKTEYAVFVYYKLESKYKKSSKFEEVMVQNQKKSVISTGMRNEKQKAGITMNNKGFSLT